MKHALSFPRQDGRPDRSFAKQDILYRRAKSYGALRTVATALRIAWNSRYCSGATRIGFTLRCLDPRRHDKWKDMAGKQDRFGPSLRDRASRQARPSGWRWFEQSASINGNHLLLATTGA